MSSLSCAVIYGIERCTSGTFTPLWFDTGPSFFTVHTMSPPSMSFTVRAISPSSSRMRAPGHTSCGSSL